MICMVTDRRRLVAGGARPDVVFACLVAQVRYAVDAGIDLVQLRERDLDGCALAVCMELQCEAGSYRDVDARIDRLTKVQAGS